MQPVCTAQCRRFNEVHKDGQQHNQSILSRSLLIQLTIIEAGEAELFRELPKSPTENRLLLLLELSAD